MYTGVCLLDMSKAFDKVRHHQLSLDLFNVGVTATALRWFMSYLSERTQRVCIGPSRSTITRRTCGVPQGSVLGPILLNVYTREIPYVAGHALSLQFADDIGLTCSKPTKAPVTPKQATLGLLSLALSWLVCSLPTRSHQTLSAKLEWLVFLTRQFLNISKHSKVRKKLESRTVRDLQL